MEFVKKNRFLDVKLELQISYSDAFSLILRTVPMSVYQCQSFWFLQFDGKFLTRLESILQHLFKSTALA